MLRAHVYVSSPDVMQWSLLVKKCLSIKQIKWAADFVIYTATSRIQAKLFVYQHFDLFCLISSLSSVLIAHVRQYHWAVCTLGCFNAVGFAKIQLHQGMRGLLQIAGLQSQWETPSAHFPACCASAPLIKKRKMNSFRNSLTQPSAFTTCTIKGEYTLTMSTSVALKI